MKKEKTIIVGLVALYKPKHEEMLNIEKYVNSLDYCFLIDDSGFSNKEVCSYILKKYPEKVEYYQNPQNMGLCASVNHGFKLAEEKGADWVLVMNPDGTFQNDAISIYREFISKERTENVAIIAPRFNIDRRKKVAGTGYVDIKYPDMTGCLYSIKILNKLGYYDENTYFYGLDLEYCLRVIKAKYRIVECSEAVLNHNPAETYEVKIIGKTILKVGKDVPLRYYYQFRSAHYIFRKYKSMYLLAFCIYKYLKVVFLFDRKKSYYEMISLGIKDSKRGFYGNFNER